MLSVVPILQVQHKFSTKYRYCYSQASHHRRQAAAQTHQENCAKYGQNTKKRRGGERGKYECTLKKILYFSPVFPLLNSINMKSKSFPVHCRSAKVLMISKRDKHVKH